MTGTVDSSTVVRMSSGPPRGISTSTYSRARMSSLALSRAVSSISCTQSFASPAVTPASSMIRVSTLFDEIALDEPRRIDAFPLFRQMPAASTVTFGRAS